MKRDTKKRREEIKRFTKIEKEVNLIEISFISIAILFAIIAIILASIGISDHYEANKILPLKRGEVGKGISSIIISIGTLILVGFLIYKSFFSSKTYGLEGATLMIFYLFILVGAVVAFVFGYISYVDRNTYFINQI